MMSKQALWPIPEVDKFIEDENESWVDEGRQLLDYYKKIGRI